MEDRITGNPKYLHPEELQEQAWPIVESYFHQEVAEVIRQYQMYHL